MPAVLRSVASCGLLALVLTACGSTGAGGGAGADANAGVPRDAPALGGYVAQEGLEAARVVKEYRTYAEDQTYDTIKRTARFVEALKNGEVKKAKALYAPSRIGWESIEPVAEAFPDIDAKVDARETDLEMGQTWTGWHRLEKALWQAPETIRQEAVYGDTLLADLSRLRAVLPRVEITVASMAAGAKELLDEVATGKVTGEEEAFSHTDLWDFKGNLEGAFKVYQLLRPVVQQRDAGLATTLDTEFADLKTLLAKHARGEGFVLYTDLSREQAKELADALNALAEPLSGLAAVTSG
ncbi:iron uptake system protein EfeO [Streptosporangium sp. NPDC051023]|uniref:iron uptake system protein EfeO n=1 Tax=Streptosporangium sp. NPDC051023 TaxID=3155410 RepID=UPI00345103E8